jgi:serine/threonine protein kinase
MSNTPRCPQCGSELPPGASHELCERCSGNQDPGITAEFRSNLSTDPTLAPRPTASPLRTGPGAAPRFFGDYEILEEIARGGMGVVYKARQVSLDRVVALKTILSGQLASEADVERFYTEARAAANLQHPNIVAIHEFGQHDGQHYFSMDYVQGQSLASLVERGPLSATQAVAYLKPIAEAIHYAHRHGILHRDLKPSNILIDSFGQPRVTDFGIAKRIGVRDAEFVGKASTAGGAAPATGSQLTTEGEVLGTPSYMSPEQIDADPATLGPTADVYSLGAILYEMLTGRPPFRARSARDTLLAVLQAPPGSIRRLNRRVPRELERICLKCLEKDPARRYPSAAALADDLERFSLGQETHAGADQKALWPRILIGSMLAFLLLCCGVPFLIVQLVSNNLGLKGNFSERLGGTVNEITTSVARDLELSERGRTWRPPANGSLPGALFPEHVGSYTLAGRDEKTEIPEFRLDLPGSRATYKSGPATVELFVLKGTNGSQAGALFTRISAMFNDEKVRVTGDLFTHYGYKFAGRMHRGTALRAGSRLLLARTTDDGKPDDFLNDYLKATGPSAADVSLADLDSPDDDEGTVAPQSRTQQIVTNVLMVLVAVTVCAGFWRVFAKGGLPGWGCLVPFYNLVLLMRLGGKPGWWAIWLFVPLLNFVIYTIVTLEVAKNFGKGVAYTLGLLLCPPLFYTILGLGYAQYNSTLFRLRQQAAAV